MINKPDTDTKPTSIFYDGGLSATKILIGPGGQTIWLKRMCDGKSSMYITHKDDKMQMLKWDGRVSNTRFAVFFDFDAVPSNLIDRFHVSTSMNMDSFESYLRFTYPGECVFRSAGGNVKMMFIFEGCSKKEATEELRECFGDLWHHIDHNALFHSIVPFEAVDAINAHIKSGNVRCGFDVDTHVWRMKHSPAIDALVAKMKGSKQKELLRFALSVNTTSGTFFLSMAYMASACKCSTATAKTFIDKAIENGDLLCVDESYCPKQLARVYKILNLSWLDAMGIEWTEEVIDLHVSMDQFVDGNWFNALWNHTRLFTTGVEFMLFVHGIEGAYAHGKHRIAKARSAWRSHAKRNGLSMEVC